MQRVVRLPDRGTLIVATDVQGNLRDFRRVSDVFQEALEASDYGAFLVVTGDLVHGPEIDEDFWPDFLGTYYRGDSRAVLEHADALQQRFPGRVHYLIGNHEHAHVGGPVVSKFFPDEAQRLEELMGEWMTRRMRAWISSWPFVAVAPGAGLVMLHAAPHLEIEGAPDLEGLPLDPRSPFWTPETQAAITSLLWARTTSTERGRAFLRAIDAGAKVAVFGHDVAREGYAIDREPLLCVSTSFGCHDGDKLYLEWDLSEPAESAADVARRGLRPLYPGAERVFRAERFGGEPDF